MKRVRVVAETGDREALACDLVDDLTRLSVRQVRDVDVARPRVPPARPRGGRPARDLEALEAVAGCPIRDVDERRLGERRGEKAEPHPVGAPASAATGAAFRLLPRSTSVQRPVRALSAIASLTSISSWPAANVGERGRWDGRPAATSS